MKKKILSCLMTSLLLVGSVLSSTVPVQAETINGENVRIRIDGIPYSDWTTIQKGTSGELSKIQYSTSDFLGYELTQTKETDDSKEVTVYYEDSEYIVLNNKKWLPSYSQDPSPIATNKNIVAYVKDDNSSDWSTSMKDEYTIKKVVANNKWGLKTEKVRDSGLDGYQFAAYNASYSRNDRSAETYTNKVNFTPLNQNLSYNIYDDPTRVVYLQTILGFGVEAGDIGWGYRIKTDGGIKVAGIETEYNEYNSTGTYSASSDGNWEGQCMHTGVYNSSYGYGGNVCYDTRIGNKTLSTTAFITDTVTDLSGNRFNIEGFTGNHYVSLFSRSYSYKATHAGVTYLSVIERIYYMDYTGASHPNTVSRFYAKPKWGNWSNWIDVPEGQSAPTNTPTRRVQTRTLYSHPLTYNVGYLQNGGNGSNIRDTLCIHGSACTTAQNTYTRTGYLNGGWALEPGAAGYVKDGATINSNDSNIKNHLVNNKLNLYAKWIPITYEIRFDANGGTGAPSTVTKTYDTNLKLPDTIPTREGFEFMGWALSPTAIVKSYDAGQIMTNDLTTVNKDHKTFYAVWKSKAYVTLASQDVYIALGTDESEAVHEALSAQSVADINYGISKDDIYIKHLVYENGTAVDMPTTIDTSVTQRIEATYAIIAADNVEKTSTSYIYIVDMAPIVPANDINDPIIFSRFVDCDMANFGIYYANSIYKNDLNYASYLEEVCKPSNTNVEKSITVYKSTTEVLMGDVNGDGKIDTADFNMLKGYLQGGNGLTIPEAADLNGDGAINSSDKDALKNIISG